jgi:hypothetical protein
VIGPGAGVRVHSRVIPETTSAMSAACTARETSNPVL